MLKGDFVQTPRFGTIRIKETFKSEKEAKENGYTEPTHFHGTHTVLGKHVEANRMVFAAAKKEG